MSVWVLLALGWVVLTVLMALLWLLHFRLRNAAVVDVGWGTAMVVLGALYGVLAPGAPWRRGLIAGMVILWGGRLAWHLLMTRVIGHEEEGRYQALRREWGAAAGRRLFWFFEAQALIAAALSVTYLIPMMKPAGGPGPAEIAGAALWLAGFSGEWLADAQLRRFKEDPSSRGKVCDAGLWRFSRHPNYFFEWLMWMGLFVAALGSPWGPVAAVGPAVILFFLFRVTGIPATEEQALRTKGDSYRRYQQTTSAFFPWFPRKPRPNS